MMVIIMVLSGIYEVSICLTMCAASNVTVLPRFTLGSVTGTFILQNVICIHKHVEGDYVNIAHDGIKCSEIFGLYATDF